MANDNLRIFFFLVCLSAFCCACEKGISPEGVEVYNIGTSDAVFRVAVDPEGEPAAVGGRNADYGFLWYKNQLDTLTAAVLADLHFLEDTVYVAGAHGVVFSHTGDYRWLRAQLNSTATIRRMEFDESGKGMLLSSNYLTDGQIIRLKNREEEIDVFETEAAVSDLIFFGDTVLVTGFGRIFQSFDFGESWNLIDQEGDFYQSIHFPSRQIGYIVGSSGSILKSKDGGLSWEHLRKGGGIGNSIKPFREVFFISDNEGFICGDGELLWHTTNGGKDWDKLIDLPKGDYHSLVVNENYLFVGGSDGLLFSLPLDEL